MDAKKGHIMADDDLRILPVTKGQVDCLPDKKQDVEYCALCIH